MVTRKVQTKLADKTARREAAQALGRRTAESTKSSAAIYSDPTAGGAYLLRLGCC